MSEVWRSGRRLRRYVRPVKFADPLAVRLYVLFHVLVGLFVIWRIKPPILNSCAFVGILFSTLGAGILYWETVMTNEDIANVAARLHHQAETGMDGFDTFAVLCNALLGILLFSSAFGKIHLIYNKISDYALIKDVLLSLAALITPVAASYFAVSLSVAYRRKRAQRIYALNDFDDRKAEIRRFYRLFGFLFLVVGGLLQAPLTLSN